MSQEIWNASIAGFVAAVLLGIRDRISYLKTPLDKNGKRRAFDWQIFWTNVIGGFAGGFLTAMGYQNVDFETLMQPALLVPTTLPSTLPVP